MCNTLHVRTDTQIGISKQICQKYQTLAEKGEIFNQEFPEYQAGPGVRSKGVTELI